MIAVNDNLLLHYVFFSSQTGEDFLKQQDIDYKSDWDLWKNIFAIVMIGIGMETLAYIQLRRMKKLKWAWHSSETNVVQQGNSFLC